jgi:3-deoxy-D-manno-octulosonic-acid transferase
VLGRVDRFCVQAPEHRDRLLALGVRPERIVVTGSLKGVERSAVPAHFVAGIAATGRPVIVAGSTHAGEESALLDALARFAGDQLPLLVLAPRHPERFAQVAGLVERQGGPWLRRSALRAEASEADLAVALRAARVLLLDTLGELAGCYSAADVAFVGGTLVPIGGHNVLEAARAGVPVVVGPHHANVARLVDRLVAAGAGAVAASSAELHPALARFLDRATAGPVRAAARAVAAGETGGLEATWAALASIADLPQPPGAEGRPDATRAAASAPGAHLA